MRDGHLLEPDEQELFRYTVREERSRFAAELPSDVQEEVSAVQSHGADFAPTVEERIAAERAAHPEISEAQARHVFGADLPAEQTAVNGAEESATDESWSPEIPEADEPTDEDASFAPPEGVERPVWARPRQD